MRSLSCFAASASYTAAPPHHLTTQDLKQHCESGPTTRLDSQTRNIPASPATNPYYSAGDTRRVPKSPISSRGHVILLFDTSLLLKGFRVVSRDQQGAQGATRGRAIRGQWAGRYCVAKFGRCLRRPISPPLSIEEDWYC